MSEDTKKQSQKMIPMVPFLKLPEGPDEDPYLLGSKCGSCGVTYLGKRLICINCFNADTMEEVRLSRTGKLFTYTVVYQSAPWVKVPYVAVVVKLPEGPVVRGTLAGFEPDPKKLKAGMPVKMVTEIVREDEAGNKTVAYKFKLLASE